MPLRCIAPGCTSGYDSNKEKVHFFCVPQDENNRKLWQAALKKDFIKAKQPVCEKHFLSTDILWNHTICDEKALLVNTKTKGQIIHPNLKLYNLIKYLESLFVKYCHRSDVFKLIIQDFYTPHLSFPCKTHLSFSCKTHGDKVLAQIIEYYILMRMRQYINKINHEKQKVNQRIKKNAKFYKN